jgi:signal transduction histidine kinase
MRRPLSKAVVYSVAALGSALLATGIGFTSLAGQFDNNIYDFLFRLAPAAHNADETVLLAFDERTLQDHGGLRGMRATLAQALDAMSGAPPAVVAVDLTLSDPGDTAEDEALSGAFARTKNLVLASEMTAEGTRWQDPLPAFLKHAAALGHVHAIVGPYDDIARAVALERVAGRQRRWALSLEAFRLRKSVPDIVSTPTEVMVGPVTIQSRWDEGRPMLVHYSKPGTLEQVSIADVLAGKDLDRLSGRVVFIGVTAQSAVRDRLFTPLSVGVPMPGVKIHEQAYSTIATGDFLYPAPAVESVLFGLGGAALAGAIFLLLEGGLAYAAGAALLVVAAAAPYLFFSRGFVLPAFAPIAATWLAVLACGILQHFYVRRSLGESEAKTERYQQAFRFVAHEMRTPLTAIQGSSELMTRYALPEEKRKELGQMINSESKRLGKMITTFLDVEKLNAGQLELRRSRFEIAAAVETCLGRAAPLAEKKDIRASTELAPELALDADRELIEYAIYNLITNAIKYSPAGSEITIAASDRNGSVCLTVADQGMGMDATEVRSLFRKFYRTKRAEASGETGTGLGLSIVDQIVTHHGGRIEVESSPGKGSRFTLLLPAAN